MRAVLGLCLLALSLPLAAAQRVVSLAPSMTEIILELGAERRLVGLLDDDRRPAELAAVPSVGGFDKLELETLLSLRPDLILLAPGSLPDPQLRQLRDLGMPLYLGDPRDLAALAEQFAEIGALVGRAERGRELRARFRDGMAELRVRYHRERPLAVFYQVWHQPLYTIGSGQILGEALEVCGAHNLFADVNLPAPQVSVESVLARAPEVILGGSGAELGHWHAWPQLPAVRLGQLWTVPDKGIERPSFQMLGATEKLCETLAAARAVGWVEPQAIPIRWAMGIGAMRLRPSCAAPS
ncbi:cobalamin-binding protein [Aquipseudomonas alcaligenes]|uniref:cobalamin-binding protein n=1 Tax=Aquipseudomonas alcaligenes TaxID=43263 RepID=UPI0035B051BB